MKNSFERTAWRNRLHLSNFINSYYQYRDCESLGDIRRILVVGPGQGLDTAVLRWRGKHVETFDIDMVMNPDHLGTVTDLSRFPDGSWDLVTASHILEHLPPSQLDSALAEIARVGRHALVYLPMAGRCTKFTIAPGVRNFDWRLIFDWIYPWTPIDPKRPCLRQGEHFWEVGLKGYRVQELIRRFSFSFNVVRHYRNTDWPQSYNFILQSRVHAR